MVFWFGSGTKAVLKISQIRIQSSYQIRDPKTKQKASDTQHWKLLRYYLTDSIIFCTSAVGIYDKNQKHLVNKQSTHVGGAEA
jgi:hypothetical protein